MRRGSLVAVALLVAAGLPIRAGAAPAPVPATLADVSFMAGRCVGGDPGDPSEELVGREEKEGALALPLVARGPAAAGFEGPEYGGPGTVRLTYRRGTRGTWQTLSSSG
jgi:hypothetical protein